MTTLCWRVRFRLGRHCNNSAEDWASMKALPQRVFESSASGSAVRSRSAIEAPFKCAVPSEACGRTLWPCDVRGRSAGTAGPSVAPLQLRGYARRGAHGLRVLLMAGNPGPRRVRPPRPGRCGRCLYRRGAGLGERGTRRSGHAGADARRGHVTHPFAPPFLDNLRGRRRTVQTRIQCRLKA